MPTAYPCVFCNRTDSPRSPEDIFAKWIGKYFPSGWKRFDLDTGEFRGSSKTIPGLVTNKVCRRCNNGWMSRLEQAVEPVMAPLMCGEKTKLSIDDQTLITRWFLKTMMAYDVNAKRKRDCYFTLDERMALMSSLAIPPDVMVFLAHYRGNPAYNIITREGHYQELDHELRQHDKSLPKTQGYAPTVVIKHLALQIFSFRRTKEFDRLFSGFDIPNWRRGSLQISPPLDEAIWPPEFALGDEVLVAFAKRWEDIGAVLKEPPTAP